MSKQFAQSGIAGYCDDDLPVFFLHASTSFELLLKSYLASRNPVLIADTQKTTEGFHSLLHLCGMSKHAKPQKVRTVGVREAYSRARALHRKGLHPLEDNEGLNTLFLVRNGVVHLGSLEDTEAHRVFSAYASTANSLLDEMGQAKDDYWGERENFVTQHLEQDLEKIKATALRKIERSRQRATEILDKLGAEEYQSLASSREPTKDYETSVIDCPACTATASMEGSPYVSSSCGNLVEEIEFEVERLSCAVCDLELSQEELRVLDYDVYPILVDGVDFDGEDAFFWLEY